METSTVTGHQMSSSSAPRYPITLQPCHSIPCVSESIRSPLRDLGVRRKLQGAGVSTRARGLRRSPGRPQDSTPLRLKARRQENERLQASCTVSTTSSVPSRESIGLADSCPCTTSTHLEGVVSDDPPHLHHPSRAARGVHALRGTASALGIAALIRESDIVPCRFVGSVDPIHGTQRTSACKKWASSQWLKGIGFGRLSATRELCEQACWMTGQR